MNDYAHPPCTTIMKEKNPKQNTNIGSSKGLSVLVDPLKQLRNAQYIYNIYIKY